VLIVLFVENTAVEEAPAKAVTLMENKTIKELLLVFPEEHIHVFEFMRVRF
jgi:hypothetical protein